MSFGLVRQLREKAVPVEKTCRVLEVSRSGYYAACRRSRVQPVVCEARVQLKAAFAASGGAYGSRRLSTAVESRGAVIGIYRVRRLMRQHGLRSVWKRKFVHTTDSKHALPISARTPVTSVCTSARATRTWLASVRRQLKGAVLNGAIHRHTTRPRQT